MVVKKSNLFAFFRIFFVVNSRVNSGFFFLIEQQQEIGNISKVRWLV